MIATTRVIYSLSYAGVKQRGIPRSMAGTCGTINTGIVAPIISNCNLPPEV